MIPKIGIIVEIASRKRSLGKQGENNELFHLPKIDGRINYCVVLPQGCLEDDVQSGLTFRIDSERGSEKENIIFFSWQQIIEVRTLNGEILCRNWYLCSKCRKIVHTSFCRSCGLTISVEQNRSVASSFYW